MLIKYETRMGMLPFEIQKIILLTYVRRMVKGIISNE